MVAIGSCTDVGPLACGPYSKYILAYSEKEEYNCNLPTWKGKTVRI